jgi:hypothetical protein
MLSSQVRTGDAEQLPMRRPQITAALLLATVIANGCSDVDVEATDDYGWCRSVRVALRSGSEGGGDGSLAPSLAELLAGIAERSPESIRPNIERLVAATSDGVPAADQAAVLAEDLQVVNEALQETCGVTLNGGIGRDRPGS